MFNRKKYISPFLWISERIVYELLQLSLFVYILATILSSLFFERYSSCWNLANTVLWSHSLASFWALIRFFFLVILAQNASYFWDITCLWSVILTNSNHNTQTYTRIYLFVAFLMNNLKYLVAHSNKINFIHSWEMFNRTFSFA